jgi:HAD superfamily hydrolase (TIGR01490 family)
MVEAPHTEAPEPAENRTRPVAAVFDLDGTVTAHPTYIPFLFSVARRKPPKLLYAGPIVLAAVAYKLGLITRGRLKEFMLKTVLGGASREAVAAYAAAFVERCIGHGLRPGALQAIAEHKARGDYLVLATASFEFYVERLGGRLGFDAVVATRSTWDDGGQILGRIDGENCYGAEKLRRLEQALPDLRASYRVIAYSDSHVDLPLLRWADVGIAVNPTGRLRTRARQDGFEVVDWSEAS